MSKLEEKIKRAGKTSPAPLGFTRGAAQAADPTMLVVVQVRDAGRIGAAAEKGADIVIVEKADTGKLKQEIEKTGACAGVIAGGASRSEVAALRDAGTDFIVVDPDASPAEATLEEKVGLVLTAGLDAEETDLRLLGDLSIDALLAPAPEGPLTLRSALRLRRVAGLARTPLLLTADPEIDAASLQVLRDSGVVGIIVDEADAGKLGKLKETVLTLRPRGRRRDDHADATLPAGVGAGDDEDDWDDD